MWLEPFSALMPQAPLQTDGTHWFPTGAHPHVKPYTPNRQVIVRRSRDTRTHTRQTYRQKKKTMLNTAVLPKAYQILDNFQGC